MNYHLKMKKILLISSLTLLFTSIKVIVDRSFNKIMRSSTKKSTVHTLNIKEVPQKNIKIMDEQALAVISQQRIDKILKKAFNKNIKGRTSEYDKIGDLARALNDFESMGLSDIKDISNGKIGTLPDGTIVKLTW